jgi:hypothetical protein
MTTFYCLRFETHPTWRARFPYLHPPGTGRPRYTTRHCVLFVAAYDPQGCSGGVRPCLHTGMTLMIPAALCNPRSIVPGRRTQRKHFPISYANRFHDNVLRRPPTGCLPRISGPSNNVVTLFRPRCNVPTEPSPSNGGPPRLHQPGPRRHVTMILAREQYSLRKIRPSIVQQDPSAAKAIFAPHTFRSLGNSIMNHPAPSRHDSYRLLLHSSCVVTQTLLKRRTPIQKCGANSHCPPTRVFETSSTVRNHVILTHVVTSAIKPSSCRCT